MSIETLNEVRKAIADLGNTFAQKMELTAKNFDAAIQAYDERLKLLEKPLKDQILKQDRAGLPHEKSWSWARFAFGIATKDWRHAPFEKEELDKYMDLVTKTMTASAFSGGGALIPPQYVAELVAFLRPQLITQRCGFRIMTGLQGSPVIIPKLTGGATASWVAPEGTSITASDQTTGRLELAPHKVAALVKISNDLLTLSNPSVEEGVRTDIVSALQEAIDTAAFQGTGAAGQPVGLQNWSPALPTVTYTTTDATTKVKSLMQTLQKLEENNALTDNLKWVMTPTSYWLLNELQDTAGRSIIQGQAVAGASTPVPQVLYGYSLFRSTLVASIAGATSNTHNVYAGNFDDAIVGIWQQVEVAASNETSTAFQNDELWIRAIARADIGVRREKSFVRLPDVES